MANRCVGAEAGPLVCPEDMVSVAGAFCVDRYEASRVDATEAHAGTDSSWAVSRQGVIPWMVSDNAAAQSACAAAGKSLCTSQQWRLACQGAAGTVYGYGDSYEPTTCNGIDLFGMQGLHILPTGSLPGCQSDWGVQDINGNLWEHVLGGGDSTVRGGAYNCIDSKTLHRCDYVPGDWTPSARGFRCCSMGSAPDAGADALEPLDASVAEVSSDAESGCIEEDVSEIVPDVSVDSPSGPDADAQGPAEAEAPDQGSPEAGDCPSDMVKVTGFCMDRYEASRSDATDSWQGSSEVASSTAGVMPWFPVTLLQARSACQAAGKRLCQLQEWVQGCTGSANTVYSYGNIYHPTTCNGIDAFCYCDSPACSGLSQCPYPHCFSQSSSEGPGPCGAQFRAVPTGSFPACVSEYGAYDVNGNVWELADSTDGLEHFRGGAFNCGNSEALHRCDHDGSWGPSARGFRCCSDL
jgi:formylglycine-generating enzyme required for sulfatase activity